jgi:hypothetical protein
MVMKKLIILVVLAFCAGGLFSEEKEGKNQERPKNAIALTFGAIAVEASYERALTDHFSVLASVSYNWFFFGDETAAAVKARWYPWAGAFFLEMGAGYANTIGLAGGYGNIMLLFLTLGLSGDQYENFRIHGLLLAPALGWRFDPGKPGGVIIPLNLGVDYIIGSRIDFVPYARVGVGFSF